MLGRVHPFDRGARGAQGVAPVAGVEGGRGIRQLELELATRVAGAVPLLLPEHMDAGEVGRLLDEIEVSLVIVDDESRLALLRRAGLRDALLFECDDRSWERLRGMGLERRKRQPDLLTWVDSVRADLEDGRKLCAVRRYPEAIRALTRGLDRARRIPFLPPRPGNSTRGSSRPGAARTPTTCTRWPT